MKIVKRKVSELKFNKEQPRKTFNEADINLLVESIKNFDLINLIEIDENNVVITGELRLKALQKLGTEEVECKLIEGLSDLEKSERQYAENEHRSSLSSEERENFVFKLWNTGKYEYHKDLANKLCISRQSISDILRAKGVRDSLPKELSRTDAVLPTRILRDVAVLPKAEQIEIVKKVVEGELTPKQVRAEVKKVKKIVKVRDEIKDRRLNYQKTRRYEELDSIFTKKENLISTLQKGIVRTEEELQTLSNQTVEEFTYIKFSSNDPSIVLTRLDEYYYEEIDKGYKKDKETITSLKKEKDEELEKVNEKYTAKILPLTEKLKTVNVNIKDIEKRMGDLGGLFDKIENNKELIVEKRKEIKEIKSKLKAL